MIFPDRSLMHGGINREERPAYPPKEQTGNSDAEEKLDRTHDINKPGSLHQRTPGYFRQTTGANDSIFVLRGAFSAIEVSAFRATRYRFA
jgi:hypothetical protein